jgi:hypothetical protein
MGSHDCVDVASAAVGPLERTHTVGRQGRPHRHDGTGGIPAAWCAACAGRHELRLDAPASGRDFWRVDLHIAPIGMPEAVEDAYRRVAAAAIEIP